MLIRRKLLKTATGILSAGGALFLAACYGPQRPPYGPDRASSMAGKVLFRDTPVAGMTVCVKTSKDQGCTLTAEDGTFTIEWMSESSSYPQVCTRNTAETPAYRETCTVVRTQYQDVVLHLEPVENDHAGDEDAGNL